MSSWMGKEIISINARLAIILELYLVRQPLIEAVITGEWNKNPSHSRFLTQMTGD